MCWVLYLASDVPLPVVDFDREKPGFNVEELPPGGSPVARQFEKPHVYIVGSHTHCGCGFDREQANPDDHEELRDAERSLGALRDYLRRAVAASGELQMYSCWDGDQGAEPDSRLTLTPEDIGPTMSWFPDRTFARIAERAR